MEALLAKKKILVICLVVVVCVGLSLWQLTPPTLAPGELPAGEALVNTKAKGVLVYVSGAVAKPGMYEVTPGSRAVDAIKQAGGFTVEANPDKVNLAKLCKDGSQVNVPYQNGKVGHRASSKTEKSLASQAAGTTAAPSALLNQNGVVNLNTASQAELETLPGIGAVTAAKIIAYRTQHVFTKIEDVMAIPGIGPAKFAKMQARLGV
ncbi:MAG: helix-hairpin-helix domain-containing protein [Acidaminococcaceae bacterium]